MPGIEQRGYRAYPLVDHVADKVAATYQRYGDQAKPSTRCRALVDLVAIVIGAEMAAQPQMAALVSEFERRGIALPARFGIPDRSLWAPGYAAAAADSILPTARALGEALALVQQFLTLCLTGPLEAYGTGKSAHGELDADGADQHLRHGPGCVVPPVHRCVMSAGFDRAAGGGSSSMIPGRRLSPCLRTRRQQDLCLHLPRAKLMPFGPLTA